MKKELISPKNLDTFLKPGETIFKLGPDKILTPGAKDALRNRGIQIQYTKEICTSAQAVPCSSDRVADPACKPEAQLKAIGAPDQIRNQTCMAMHIVEILDKDYGISDPEMLKTITIAVISQLNDLK